MDSRFNELYESDKKAIINLINTMASFKGIIDFKDDIEAMKDKAINKWREEEDSDSEEEEEDWMDVYYEGPIQDFTKSKTFDEFSRNNTFYMTMGGGPTGGVLVDEDGKVWEVSVKGWGAEWTCEPTDYDGVEVREEDRKKGISKAIKVVNNDEWNTAPYLPIHIRKHKTIGIPVIEMNGITMRLEELDDEDDLQCHFDIGDTTVSVFFTPSTTSGHIELWNFITKKRIEDRPLRLIYEDNVIWTNN